VFNLTEVWLERPQFNLKFLSGRSNESVGVPSSNSILAFR